jgi:hypothetical protein
MAYATVDDVRAFAPDLDATDDAITDALGLAEELVSARALRTFATPAVGTETISDVRTANVVITKPFSAVTAVSVEGSASPVTGYTVESWGIRLPYRPWLDREGRGPDVISRRRSVLRSPS